VNRVFRFLLFFGVFLVPLSAEEPSQYIKRFENTYRRAATLRVTFLERYSESGRVARVESGIAYFRRPGKMRWEYESPEKNVFLVDGKTAWFYVQADHTAMRVPARKSTDWRTPLALLAGGIKVSHICAHVAVATTEKPEAPENVLLRCILREPSPGTAQELELNPDAKPYDALFFEIVRSTGELKRILIGQGGGVSLEFRFSNWQINPLLDDSFFRFQVPPGVAIVDGEPAQKGANP
jgi:outer membrane lipoprotein carrier protein